MKLKWLSKVEKTSTYQNWEPWIPSDWVKCYAKAIKTEKFRSWSSIQFTDDRLLGVLRFSHALHSFGVSVTWEKSRKTLSFQFSSSHLGENSWNSSRVYARTISTDFMIVFAEKQRKLSNSDERNLTRESKTWSAAFSCFRAVWRYGVGEFQYFREIHLNFPFGFNSKQPHNSGRVFKMLWTHKTAGRRSNIGDPPENSHRKKNWMKQNVIKRKAHEAD